MSVEVEAQAIIMDVEDERGIKMMVNIDKIIL